jgi:hypothetical protein
MKCQMMVVALAAALTLGQVAMAAAQGGGGGGAVGGGSSGSGSTGSGAIIIDPSGSQAGRGTNPNSGSVGQSSDPRIRIDPSRPRPTTPGMGSPPTTPGSGNR